MTASELYEIVKDVPRVAWPDLEWVDMRWVDGHTEAYTRPELAEQAFVGSMTAWLVERGQYPTSSKVGAGDDLRYITLTFADESKKGVGTSLVAALAAACKEVQ